MLVYVFILHYLIETKLDCTLSLNLFLYLLVVHLSPQLSPQAATIEDDIAFKFPEVGNKF
jgi:hypothetical protein